MYLSLLRTFTLKHEVCKATLGRFDGGARQHSDLKQNFT